MKLAKLATAIAVIMMMTVLAAPAVSAEDSVDLTATVLEPKPEIGIELSTNALNFGSLYPGNTSEPQDLKVTNIGLKTVDVTVTASDDGAEPLFVPGLLIDNAAYGDYLATLSSDESDDTHLALHVPDDYASRGDVSGGATFWAEEHRYLPEADFSASPVSGDVPLDVQFTDLSTNAPTSWSWDFGDGATSTEQSPSHTYTVAGNYSITLTATNSYGSDTVTKSAYITANEVILHIYSTAQENTNTGAPDPAIAATSTKFKAWASSVVNYSPTSQYIQPEFGNSSLALGPATGGTFDIVSLGELTREMIDAGDAPGSITFGFDVTIINGPGPDLAAFENGFISSGGLFAELGYVDVSTDGVTFARFPSIDLNSHAVGGYGTVDSTNIYNLVGKHSAGWGTPFDLSDLVNDPAVLNGSVDLNNINYVRIVDIPGSGDFKDSLGNPIYDAWPTWGSGGLDFEALGVINMYSAADFQYTSDGTSAIITGYTGTGGNVLVPSTLNGLPVTSIGNTAFKYKSLTSVTIPDSVTSIGTNAFYGCASLTSVILGDGLTSIGNSAFSGCTALTSVTIPDSVTSIGNSVFSGCKALTSVIIPDSVTSIGNSVFNGCTALVTIAIGSGVTSIGTNAFSGCTSLTAINVDASNTAYASIDGTLYNNAISTLVQCPNGKIGAITIPDSVTSIGNSAFSGCKALTSVIIPDSVTSIGNSAFSGCMALTSVIIPDSVTSIGNSAFSGCMALTSVTIGNGVTSIGRQAFYKCTALASITIPDSVISIGDNLLFGCSALTSITIGNGITSLGDQILQECTALTSVTIPDSVTTIGQQAFYGCTALVSMALGDGVTSIGDNAFYGCTALTSVTIPGSVTSISDNAFYGCTALTTINVDASNSAFASVDGVLYNKALTFLKLCPPGKAGSLVIPSSVTNIAGSALMGCTALTSVTIPDSVTSIGDMMFYGCTALTSITIGKGVTSIGFWSFNGCSALISVTFNGNAPTVGFGWADGVPSTMVVYYHQGATGFTNPWNGFTTVELSP